MRNAAAKNNEESEKERRSREGRVGPWKVVVVGRQGLPLHSEWDALDH